MASKTEFCLSCLTKENIYNLFETYECEGSEEVYAEMLQSCFDVSISSESNANNMCESCILQLREAFNFKQTICRNIKKLEKSRIKVELLEDSIEDNISADFLSESDEDTYMVVVDHGKETNNKENCSRDPNTIQLEKFEVSNVTIVYNKKQKEAKGNDVKSDDKFTEKINVKSGSENETHEIEQLSSSQKKLTPEPDPDLPQKQSNTTTEPEAQTTQETNEEPLREYTCEYCGKNFAVRRDIERHISDSHVTGQYPCHVCGKVFNKRNSLRCHSWRVHASRGAYVCSHCGERFATLHQRLRHLDTEHRAKPTLPCPYCDNLYHDYSTRSQHISYKHLKVRNHKCTLCRMAFYKLRNLTSHMATVHDVGEKKFGCHVCEKKFFTSATLKAHLKRHDKYNCEVCKVSCSYDNLKAHKKLHIHCLAAEQSTDQSVDQSIDGVPDGSNDTVYFEVDDFIE